MTALILVLSIVASVMVYNHIEARRIECLRSHRKQARAMAERERLRRIKNASNYNKEVYLAERRTYDCKRYLR